MCHWTNDIKLTPELQGVEPVPNRAMRPPCECCNFSGWIFPKKLVKLLVWECPNIRASNIQHEHIWMLQITHCMAIAKDGDGSNTQVLPHKHQTHIRAAHISFTFFLDLLWGWVQLPKAKKHSIHLQILGRNDWQIKQFLSPNVLVFKTNSSKFLSSFMK